jgi:mono/diheme cytochrome c family protein
MAQLTSEAASAAETREAAQSALASPGAGSVDLALAGDPITGRTVFMQRCQSCHRPGGAGLAPDLTGASNPTINYSDQELVDLLRTGEGHATPPGPMNEVALNEQQLINILAFIREQSE